MTRGRTRAVAGARMAATVDTNGATIEAMVGAWVRVETSSGEVRGEAPGPPEAEAEVVEAVR